MNIILLTKSGGKPVTRQLNSYLHFLVLGVLLVGGSMGLAYLGYWYGLQKDTSQYADRWATELAAQRTKLQHVKEEARANVDALTLRLGQIQGYVSRLDALGMKLVKMAKLDSDEFNFGELPALGGPESPDEIGVSLVPDLQLALADLSEQLEQRERELSVLEDLILNRNLTAEVSPAGRPTKRGWLSSGWGMRSDPFTGRAQFHKGVDFAGRKGQDIVAVASGIVTFSGNHYGFGKMVEINHGNGISTRYAHNSQNVVKEGDAIKKGDVVAKMGTTGRSTGYHVHFEVLKDGKPVNPAKFLATK